MEKQIAERKKKLREEKQMQRKALDDRKKRLEVISTLLFCEGEIREESRTSKR